MVSDETLYATSAGAEGTLVLAYACADCCEAAVFSLVLVPFPRAVLFVFEASPVIHVGRSAHLFLQIPKGTVNHSELKTQTLMLRDTWSDHAEDLESPGVLLNITLRSCIKHSL